jgi:hypothetical protein
MRPKNLAGFIAIAILLVGLTAYIAPSTVPSISRVDAVSSTIALVGNYPNWNSSNPQITVTKGDTLTVSLSRIDGHSHQFLVDFDKDGVGDTADCGTVDQCSGIFSTTPPPLGPFTVSSNPDTYTYYCTIHYPYMQGNFVVLSPTSSADFAINSNPASLTVSQGSSGTTSVTASSLNGFSGIVDLTVTVSPSGPQSSVNPSSVTLSAGGSASSTLTVSTSPSGYYSTPLAQGSYSVNITASSGTVHHSTTVSLTIGSTSTTPPGASNLPLLQIAGGIVAIIVVIGAVVFLRRRKH